MLGFFLGSKMKYNRLRKWKHQSSAVLKEMESFLDRIEELEKDKAELIAEVAHLVERLASNQEAAGSSPVFRTII